MSEYPYTLRPIDRWPGENTRSRRRSPFTAKMTATMNLLSRELRMLGARNVVLQVAVRERDIRLDGRLRADARAPDHPGVILAFDSQHGPLKYAVDTYTRWEDNLRGIALALEALRAVDRYGVTKRGEQYTGWRAIPQHTGSGFATAEDAMGWMIARVDEISGMDGLSESWSEGDVDDSYKLLARHLHPDTPGGSHEEFVKLQQAKALIEERAKELSEA